MASAGTGQSCFWTTGSIRRFFPLGVNCCVFPASTDSTLLRLDSTLANYLQRHTDVYLRRQEILDMYECLLDLQERKMADTDVISHMSDILGIKERQLKKVY